MIWLPRYNRCGVHLEWFSCFHDESILEHVDQMRVLASTLIDTAAPAKVRVKCYSRLKPAL